MAEQFDPSQETPESEATTTSPKRRARRLVRSSFTKTPAVRETAVARPTRAQRRAAGKPSAARSFLTVAAVAALVGTVAVPAAFAATGSAAAQLPVLLLPWQHLLAGQAYLQPNTLFIFGSADAVGAVVQDAPVGLAVGSVEWQRPITIKGNTRDFEHAVFMDAGTVGDELNHMYMRVGVGTGIRWKSPVGPIQADLAYGLQEKQLRLHLRLGFTF